MKTVIQRVNQASVEVNNKIISKIDKGILALIGFSKNDSEKDIEYIINKIIKLRIFKDSKNKMNFSLKDIKGQLLIVPQFTLYGSCLKGNRPDFLQAANIETGKNLFDKIQNFCLTITDIKIKFGKFQADMKVNLLNDGPVTLILESRDKIK